MLSLAHRHLVEGLQPPPTPEKPDRGSVKPGTAGLRDKRLSYAVQQKVHWSRLSAAQELPNQEDVSTLLNADLVREITVSCRSATCTRSSTGDSNRPRVVVVGWAIS